MNNKMWIVFAIVVVLGLGGLVVWKSQQDNAGTSNIDFAQFDANRVINDSTIPASFTGDKYVVTDNAAGKLDSKVTVIEYADYQCPGCYSLAPTMKSVQAAYSDRVAFVYRYFPLPYHSNGFASATASESAARQGKFWEMHDIIFENKPNWENASSGDREDIFATYAEQAGVPDMNKWHDDYKNYTTNGIKEKINFQQGLGKANDVKQTPTVIVNGVTLTDTSESAITSAIDAELAK